MYTANSINNNPNKPNNPNSRLVKLIVSKLVRLVVSRLVVFCGGVLQVGVAHQLHSSASSCYLTLACSHH